MDRILVVAAASIIVLIIYCFLRRQIIKNKKNRQWISYFHTHEWVQPNSISLWRLPIALMAFIPYLLWKNSLTAIFVSVFIYVFAAIMDGLDGDVARNFNLISEKGKNRDSLMDKPQYLLPLGYFGAMETISINGVFLIFLFDLLGQTLRYFSYKYLNALASSEIFGKIKTVVCFILVVFCFMFAEIKESYPYLNFVLFSCLALSAVSCLKKIPINYAPKIGIKIKRKLLKLIAAIF